MVLEYGPHVHLDKGAFDSGCTHAKRVRAMESRAKQSNEVFNNREKRFQGILISPENDFSPNSQFP